jgi:hypothetical protein
MLHSIGDRWLRWDYKTLMEQCRRRKSQVFGKDTYASVPLFQAKTCTGCPVIETRPSALGGWRLSNYVHVNIAQIICCLYLSFSLSLTLLPTHFSCTALLFHLVTLSDTPHSVGLLWTRDRTVADTSTCQNTALTTDRLSCRSGIRTRNPSKQTAEYLGLRPRCHRGQLPKVMVA